MPYSSWWYTILYAIYNFICHISYNFIFMYHTIHEKKQILYDILTCYHTEQILYDISLEKISIRGKKKKIIFFDQYQWFWFFPWFFSFWFCEIYEVGLFMRLFDAEFGAELYGFLISCYARIWLTYLSPGYLSMCSRFLSLCFLTMFGRDPEEQYKSTQRTPEIHSARSLIGANKNLGVWRTPMGYSEIRGSMGYFVITSRGVLRKFSHHFGFFIVFFPFALDFTRWDCPWDDLTRWKDVLLRWQIEITSRTIVRRESPISFRRRAIRDTCSNCSWCNRTEAARNRIA